MHVIGTRLRRRIWQPLLLVLAAAAAAPLILGKFVQPPASHLLWIYAAGLIAVTLSVGALLSKMIVGPVSKLANLAESLSPGLLESVSLESDELTALSETVSRITSEMRHKEQLHTGDMESHSQAMQKLSRSLQEQAASFETALNSMDLPICLFESDGGVLQANQKFCQMLGIQSDRLRGMGMLAVIAELRKLVTAPDKMTAEAEAIYRKPSVARDATFPLRDGRGIVRIYCVPIFGEMSSLVGVIISADDSVGAGEVEHLKSEFISTVSHELRTPLTAVKGAVGLVLGGAGGPVPGPIRDLLEIAGSNTDRLIQLVNDILEIFRMETGKLQLRPVPSSVPELVGKACSQTQKEAENTGIRLETRVATHLPLALVDTEQVQKVLEKLISNAIKFSINGSIVRIGAEPMPDNPKYLLVWVQDHGQGIAPEAQERIFEKFEQAESVLTRQHQGSGLGLAICRGIVEGHGGRIWVKSELHKGSTFYLTLPVAQATAKQAGAIVAGAPGGAASRVPAAVPPSGLASRRLVMIVEDDPDTRNVVSRMLQGIGHVVLEVSTGSPVPDLAIRHQPDLIVLDMLLPDVTGMEIMQRLKASEKTRGIPVVCMSVSEEMSTQASAGGAALFFRKPLDTAALMRGIQVATTTSGQA